MLETTHTTAIHQSKPVGVCVYGGGESDASHTTVADITEEWDCVIRWVNKQHSRFQRNVYLKTNQHKLLSNGGFTSQVLGGSACSDATPQGQTAHTDQCTCALSSVGGGKILLECFVVLFFSLRNNEGSDVQTLANFPVFMATLILKVMFSTSLMNQNFHFQHKC